MSTKRYLILSLVITSLLVLTACSPAPAVANPTPAEGAPDASTVEVALRNFRFSPADITIKAGTTVVWTNQDSTAHTVTSGTRDAPTDLFDSGDVGNGETFSFTFATPGVYPYHCTPHQGMDGTITVE
jgi:plastocyanin